MREKSTRDHLIPLDSRIRARLAMEQTCRSHLLDSAGSASLMTEPLRQTLGEHAAGNHRLLMNLASELLAPAAQCELSQIDEKLYLKPIPHTRAAAAIAENPMTDLTFLPRLGPMLPKLTDADAAAVRDYFHELVMLVESHYLVQIRRHAQSQLQLAEQAPPRKSRREQRR
nr:MULTISPECIES: hypothetical protein [unclassified Cupriavidus]